MNVARSELVRLSASKNISEGVTTGTTEGIAWKIIVTSIDGNATNGPSAMRPFKVEVRAADAYDKTEGMPVIETILLGRLLQP